MFGRNSINCIIAQQSVPITQTYIASLFPAEDPDPNLPFYDSSMPVAGKYIVSAWVREDAIHQQISYTNANLNITLEDEYATGFQTINPLYDISLLLTGKIIDGWQKIEGVVDLPTFPIGGK